jgi:protein-disulfide isomerase
VSGFVFGSLWTENKMLSTGRGGSQVVDAAQVPNQPAAPAQPTELSEADWKEVQADPALTIGNRNAKVTMVEFTDYQCPFCARHYTQTHGELVKKYVDTGKLRIIYRDQALPFHPNANAAAQSVRCAVESNGQEGGKAMHDALFATQDQWASLSGDAVSAKFTELANGAKLNGSKIAECVTSGKFKKAVDDDSALGSRVGAGGTPTFFIEGTALVGAQPLSAFEQIIDAKLN